jgi:hypothetical protein
MNYSQSVLFLALILTAIGATAGSPLRAANSEWDDLTILRPGQQIRVVLNDAKSYQGAFQALNDEGITLRQAAGEQTFARKDILRVDAYSGVKNHRLRNIVMGAAAGAILAIPVVLANRNRYNDWWKSSAWVWLVFVPAGAGIGATLPTAGWHEVYRAHRHR